MGPTAVHLQDGSLHKTKTKRATIRFPGEGAIARILKELSFSSKMVKKKISALCMYSVTENVKQKVFSPLRPEINNFSSSETLTPHPPWILNGRKGSLGPIGSK